MLILIYLHKTPIYYLVCEDNCSLDFFQPLQIFTLINSHSSFIQFQFQQMANKVKTKLFYIERCESIAKECLRRWFVRNWRCQSSPVPTNLPSRPPSFCRLRTLPGSENSHLQNCRFKKILSCFAQEIFIFVHCVHRFHSSCS